MSAVLSQPLGAAPARISSATQEPVWVRLLLIPRPYLYSGILIFALIGIWGVSNSWVDLVLMVLIGLMGYVMRVYDFPIAPVLIGLILGPMAETELRRALAIGQGDPMVLVSTPIAATMLAAGARHPNCAYKWLEWSISPKVQGDLASWFGSNPVVPKACEGNELLGPDGCKTNGFENFEKIKFWRTPEAKCKSSPEGCVPYSKWVTDYVAVMGGN